jgi:aldehyde dehydrogenase (NAD+)
MNIKGIFEQQQHFFQGNTTKSISFRIAQLKKVHQVLKENEERLFDAIYADFGKSAFETYITELGIMYEEINSLIKNVPAWSRRRRVRTGLANFPAKSYIIPEPLGVTLVIGAWNYPYQLSILPALTAMAAGNTVIIKPSELPSHTSALMAELINSNFDRNYLYVLEGGVQITTDLLELPFDKIFFTGSTHVGRIVYQAAAKHLTPVTLELGGKSPTFVLKDADIKMTAKRIVWAKFLNAGQTCVAPDYILAEKEIEQDLLIAMRKEIDSMYNFEKGIPENYLQIINDRNFDRLTELIDREKCLHGGSHDRSRRFIEPTILSGVHFSDKIMEDEIFGPILPVLYFDDLDEVIVQVKQRPKPLSCYIYGKDKKVIDKILHEVSFGGGCINDSIMHLSNSRLPFGGVGQSGMGSYHGKAGFDSFSHHKSMLEKPFWFEAPVKYAPYTDWKKKLVKWLLG